MGSEGMASRVLNVGTRRRWMTSSSALQFTSRETTFGAHWIGGRVGPSDTKWKR